MPPLLTGMPVESLWALVGRTYIPKGVVCQSSTFALARNPRNFHRPLEFRPERWLSADEGHPLFDPHFAADNRKGFQPFSQWPRMCSGREIAWWQSRVFLAKVLWKFDPEGVPGLNNKADLDRDTRGWGMYVKPEFQVRFMPVGQKDAA